MSKRAGYDLPFFIIKTAWIPACAGMTN